MSGAPTLADCFARSVVNEVVPPESIAGLEARLVSPVEFDPVRTAFNLADTTYGPVWRTTVDRNTTPCRSATDARV